MVSVIETEFNLKLTFQTHLPFVHISFYSINSAISRGLVKPYYDKIFQLLLSQSFNFKESRNQSRKALFRRKIPHNPPKIFPSSHVLTRRRCVSTLCCVIIDLTNMAPVLRTQTQPISELVFISISICIPPHYNDGFSIIFKNC